MSAEPRAMTLTDHLLLETEQEPREPVEPRPLCCRSNDELRAWYEGYSAGLGYAKAILAHATRSPR